MKTIAEEIALQRGLDGNNYWETYRGESCKTYKLRSGLFRFNKSINELKTIEQKLFAKFKEAVSQGKIVIHESNLIDEFKNSSDWTILFQAQHAGLKTRLLDWTMSWKMALAFAVDKEKHFGVDGHIWILKCPIDNLINDNNKQVIISKSPFVVENFFFINYPFHEIHDREDLTFERRRFRQNGRFSIQSLSQSSLPLNEQNDFKAQLQEIIVDGNSKKDIKNELATMGLTIDWALYRSEDSVDKTIKEINRSELGEVVPEC